MEETEEVETEAVVKEEVTWMGEVEKVSWEVTEEVIKEEVLVEEVIAEEVFNKVSPVVDTIGVPMGDLLLLIDWRVELLGAEEGLLITLLLPLLLLLLIEALAELVGADEGRPLLEMARLSATNNICGIDTLLLLG